MRRLLAAAFLSVMVAFVPAHAEEAPAVEGPTARAAFDEVVAVGLTLTDASEPWSVAAVERGSPAARAGFHVGDRIVRIGGKSPAGTYTALIHATLAAARKTDNQTSELAVEIQRDGAKRTLTLDLSSGEIDVLVATTRALDYLSDEIVADPTFGKTRPRAYYAPIIYAPLSGLAFLSGGSTRHGGRHATALRAVLAYVMEHGGKRKTAQDAINKAVGGNICSLTHNAGYSAMFLAQLIDSEASNAPASPAAPPVRFLPSDVRKKLGACCEALAKIQLKNGGWQHGSGGANPLGYTHFMAATVTAMNGLAMARQVGVDAEGAAIERGLGYVRKATHDGRVDYAVGNAGSFSAGRNAAVIQLMIRLGLQDDDLVEPMRSILFAKLEKAGTGHASPIWHLYYVGLAAADSGPEASTAFETLYRALILGLQADDGSIPAPEAKGTQPGTGEENRVWGPLYTTPLLVLALRAPYRRDLLLYDFAKHR